MLNKELRNSLSILAKLRMPNGVFIAAPNKLTGYNKMWLRDTIYESIPFEKIDPVMTLRMYDSIISMLKRYSQKIDWAITNKPSHSYQFIHARYHPLTLDEFWEEWGNKQNDAIGLLLFKIGELTREGFRILRSPEDHRIVQKLVHYLESINYWAEPDHGVWEEVEMLHSSSLAACVAGLEAVKGIVEVPDGLIEKGRVVLRRQLPRESEERMTDMALLTLIWPFNIVSDKMGRAILRNVERRLVRSMGVLRYEGDAYYNVGAEAEWPLGLHWLALIHKHDSSYERYLALAKQTITRSGEIPEIYYANTTRANPNTPLGWAHAIHALSIMPQ